MSSPLPGEEWESHLWRDAEMQATRAAQMVGLPEDIHARIIRPRRSLVVHFPLQMDDGRVQELTGYRVQHTLTMGPTKGGVRYHESVSLGECAALALLMSLKCLLLELPFGGAKGGVRVDATGFSESEKEKLTRRFASELMPLLGPDKDIPAPDLGTGEREMAWFMDTYSHAVGYGSPGIVTGKPLVLGGTAGRRDATGLGAVMILEEVLRRRGERIEGKKFVVQGLGNVGSVAAREIYDRGGKIVGVADVSSSMVSEGGVVLEDLFDWLLEEKYLQGFPGAEEVKAEDFLSTPCDVLVPAALERVITAENASALNCQLVLEAANGPTTPEADRILDSRGILAVPDILVNAGGVTVSYFEWVQAREQMYWTEDVIRQRLQEQLVRALDKTIEEAEYHSSNWRTGAQISGLVRLAEAAELRGIYP